jgi:hypothetical protein
VLTHDCSLNAAGDALGDKFDEHNHEANASVHKEAAKH